MFRISIRALVPVVAGLLLSACATGGPGEPPTTAAPAADEAATSAEAPASAETPTAEDAPAEGAAAAAEPMADEEPDTPREIFEQSIAEMDEQGEWLVDERSGYEYQLREVQKVEGAYRRLDNGRIRFRFGTTFDVVDETDDHFVVKAYKPQPLPKVEPEPVGPSPEQLAKAAEMFRVATPSSDRLRLEAFDRGLPRSGQWREGFDVADLDGDGRLDIVSGPFRKGPPSPHVYRFEGDGTWSRWENSGFPRLAYDYGDAAVGDFDGDGLLDVVFGVHLRGLLAVRQKPTGGFEQWREGIQFDVPGKGGDASSFSSRQVLTTDWDGDGRVDILALGEGPKGRMDRGPNAGGGIIGTSRGIVLYRNLGGGTWEPFRLDAGQGVFGDDLVLADFDGDGDDDILVASRTRGDRALVYLRGDDNRLERREIAGLPADAFVEAVGALPGEEGEQAALVIGYRISTLGVWRTVLDLYRGESWEQRTILAAPEIRDAVTSIGTGDLDGDGRPDIVAGTGTGELWTFLATADGGFVREQSDEMPEPVEGCGVTEIRLVEMDGTPGDEMIVGFAGEPVGFSGLPNLSKPGCRGQGALRAWTRAD